MQIVGKFQEKRFKEIRLLFLQKDKAEVEEKNVPLVLFVFDANRPSQYLVAFIRSSFFPFFL